MSFRTAADRSPITTVLGIWALVFILSAFAGILREVYDLTILQQVAVFDSCLAIAGLALLFHLGWWRAAGYASWGRTGTANLFVPLVLVAFISYTDGIAAVSPPMVLAFALLALLIGFAEETIFRGLILTALLPAGIRNAVLVSALLFALPHLLNAIGGIWDPVFTVADTVAAFGIGISFAALRLRSGSIWPLIGIHALIDFNTFMSIGGVEVTGQSPAALVLTVLVGVVLAAYGLFLIRGCHRPREGMQYGPSLQPPA
jgi:membrane protease YdiL (CAAX protease family)